MVHFTQPRLGRFFSQLILSLVSHLLSLNFLESVLITSEFSACTRLFPHAPNFLFPTYNTRRLYEGLDLHNGPFCVGSPSAVITSQASLPTVVGAQNSPHGSVFFLISNNF